MRELQYHFSHHVSSLLLCAHLFSSPAFSQFLQCRHFHTQHMVPGVQLLSSPTLIWLGLESFVRTRASLRVPFDLKVVLMPRFLHSHSILSLIPLIYGKWRNLAVCCCSSVWVGGSRGGVGRFLRVWLTICVQYPFSRKTCFRWFCSLISLVAWQMFLALVPRHLMMPDLILAWWWELYLSVCVFLRKTEVVASVPSICTSTVHQLNKG